MAKLTKAQKSLVEKYDLKKSYTLNQAIDLVKKTSLVKFDSSVDIAVKLGIDIKKPLQMIRTSVPLTHGTGKTPRILVICTPDKEKEAKEAGADHVGMEEYLTKIEKESWTDFDVMITMPSLMMKVGKLGRILGPSGKMPNPKMGTVTVEVGKTVKAIKSGKVSLKCDKAGIIHSSVGRVSFAPQQLKENVEDVIKALINSKHSTVKGGTYLKSIYLTTTMGPGVQVNLNSIEKN